MAEEAEYPQLFCQRGTAAIAKDRTVAELVSCLFTASCGCSESLVGGSFFAAENGAQPAPPDDKVLSKAGAEAQQKVSWNTLPEYKSIIRSHLFAVRAAAA